MRHLPKTFAIIIAAVIVTGCANKRKVTTVTETTTTVTDLIDTIVPIPAAAIKVTVPLLELQQRPLTFEDDRMRIDLSFDTLTGNLTAIATAKADSVPVQFERTTTTHNINRHKEKTTDRPVNRWRWFWIGVIAGVSVVLAINRLIQ